MTHYVYEFIAHDGSHLYVGCTNNIALRLGAHRAKNWWGDVLRIEVDSYPTEADALAAERERIELYQPSRNTVFTDKHDTFKSHRTIVRLMSEAHARGDFCGYSRCRDCISRAHSLNVTCCRFISGCTICRNFAPWWSLLSAEERRARGDWEPLWEDFLDHEPSWDELDRWFTEHDRSA